MGMNRRRNDHKRISDRYCRGPRWKALRMQALDRDGWACVQCGRRTGLECDHIEPVRDRPDLAYRLDNIQVLCGRCHARKTRIEVGMGQPDPKRDAWKNLLRDMQRNPQAHKETFDA